MTPWNTYERRNSFWYKYQSELSSFKSGEVPLKVRVFELLANTEEGTFRLAADRSTQRRMGLEVIMHCAVVGCFRPNFGGPWLILNRGKFQFHWALYPMQVYKGNEGWLSGQSSCTAEAEWQADSPTTVPSFSLCLHKVKNQAYVNAIVAHFSITCISYQVSLPSILSAKYTSYSVFQAIYESIRSSAHSFQMFQYAGDCLLSTCAVWLFRLWLENHTYSVNTLPLSFGSSLYPIDSSRRVQQISCNFSKTVQWNAQRKIYQLDNSSLDHYRYLCMGDPTQHLIWTKVSSEQCSDGLYPDSFSSCDWHHIFYSVLQIKSGIQVSEFSPPFPQAKQPFLPFGFRQNVTCMLL